MKKSTSWLSLLLSLSIVLNGVMFYRFIIAGAPVEMADQRTAIILEEGERELVLAEMRQFLIAVQGITQAIRKENMDNVVKEARAVGTTAAAAVPASLMGKLPLEFKQLGLKTHQNFDAIALDAESLGDGAHAMEQLGQLLDNCIACHSTYQIRPTPLKP